MLRIAIRTERAKRIIAVSYTGTSKRQKKATSVRNLNNLKSWRRRPREEQRADTARKFPAVPFNLELASHNPKPLRPTASRRSSNPLTGSAATRTRA